MKKKWILSHCDLDLWPKVINFDRVRASGISNHLAKTASKSVYPFGWNFVHKKSGHTDGQTHTQRQTEVKINYNPSTTLRRCSYMQTLFFILISEIHRFRWPKGVDLERFFADSIKSLIVRRQVYCTHPQDTTLSLAALHSNDLHLLLVTKCDIPLLKVVYYNHWFPIN